jgi:hypothetical protein
MAIPAVVLGVMAAVEAAPGVVNGIESVLDKFFGRSILFEVSNTLGEPLRIEFDGDGHSSGGFSHPPPHMIAPMSTAVFASRSVGDLRGSLRLVGNDVWFGFSFSNPVSGAGYFRSSVNGRRASEFKAHAVKGKGNKNARFLYVAHYSDLNRVTQEYRKHTGEDKPKPAPKPAPKKKKLPELRNPGDLLTKDFPTFDRGKKVPHDQKTRDHIDLVKKPPKK